MVPANTFIKMINTIQTGIVLINSEFEICYSNNYFQEKTGYRHEELKGLGFFNNLVREPGLRKALIGRIKSCFEKPFTDFELDMIKCNGSTLSVKINGSAFKENDELYVCFMITDVTSQRAFEKVIQAGYDNLQQTTIDLDGALRQIREQQALLTQYKQKMTRELAIATSVQNAIIPAKFRSGPDLNIWGISCPSEELGGDYFDFFQIEENIIGILVADVVGHGVPAALIATMLKAYFEYFTKSYRIPDRVFYYVNKAMAEILEDTGLYLTAFYSVLDLNTMEITSTSAGHDSALCFYAGGRSPEKLNVEDNGTILGAFSDSEYDSITIKLKPGARLVFFTDGITEAKNAQNEFFGNTNFENYIKEHQHLSPKEAVEGLLAVTDAFYGTNRPNDDRTLIIIDVLPGEAGGQQLIDPYGKVRQLIKARKYSEASELLQQTTEPEGLVLAGKTKILLGQYSQAVIHLKQAIEQDAASYRAYYYLGIAEFNLKKYTEAKSNWLQVKKLQGSFKKVDEFLEKLASL